MMIMIILQTGKIYVLKKKLKKTKKKQNHKKDPFCYAYSSNLCCSHQGLWRKYYKHTRTWLILSL